MKEILAICGGTPVRSQPLGNPLRTLGPKASEYVSEVLESRHLNRTGGVWVSRLEKEFAGFYGAQFCTASTSGTAAIHLAALCGAARIVLVGTELVSGGGGFVYTDINGDTVETHEEYAATAMAINHLSRMIHKHTDTQVINATGSGLVGVDVSGKDEQFGIKIMNIEEVANGREFDK